MFKKVSRKLLLYLFPDLRASQIIKTEIKREEKKTES